MTAYDTIRFAPPAPVALVSLRNPATGVTVSEVPMLLDSGADVTLVPLPNVMPLNLPSDPTLLFEMAGFDGHRSSARAVNLELIFLGRTFRGQFLLIDQECGVIGRNLLNHLALLLDGPNASWSEQRSAGA